MTCSTATTCRLAGSVPEAAHSAGVPGSFFRQLDSPAFVLDVRPQPPQPGHRGPPASAQRSPQPCVLLLSRSRDAELDAVGRLLGKVGVLAARIDADALAAIDLVIDPERGVVRLDGAWLAPTVAWSRHFSARAIGPDHTGGNGPAPGTAAAALFRRDSWRAVASQLTLLSRVRVDSPLVGLLDQQAMARRLRIATPRTIVTTDAARAGRLLNAGRLVIKAIDQHFIEASPGLLTGIFPVIAERAGSAPATRPHMPVIVQEYVEHDAELRVYYVDDEVLGFEVAKDAPADLWISADQVGVRQVSLPGPVISAARRLAAGLALRFGAFDFLLRDGIPVFLEVNPDGDWRWAEEKARTAQVTVAVAAMLGRLHRNECDGRSEPLNLIRFLGHGDAPRTEALRAEVDVRRPQ